MEIHEEFTNWAVERGVKINGVAAHKFEGRGLGIIATKKHEADSVLVTVPKSALLTVDTVPASLSSALNPITVHGLLAADLCLSPNPSISPWKAVLPTWISFQETMPLLYPASLRQLLPPAAALLVTNQERKLALDWGAVHSAFPSLEYEKYLHAWLLINTRTFYFAPPTNTKGKPTPVPKNRDDCMALNPFADYFNHTATPAPHTQPCSVAFTVSSSFSGYKITSSVPIAKGKEIYISYGNHSNDFLLAEYGFILDDDENQWDEIPLDEYILPLFSSAQKDNLKDAGFLGKYVLDTKEVCYRTQTSLRILCMPVGRWQRIAEGFEDGEKYQGEVNTILCKSLKKYQKDVQKSAKQVAALGEGLPEQTQTLGRRWRQIDLLLQTAIDRIQS